MKDLITEGSWNRIKGKLREKYGQLTDNDLEFMKGKEEELFGRLQTKLGLSREQLVSVINNLKEATDAGAATLNETVEQLKKKATDFTSDVKSAAIDKARELGEQTESMVRSIHQNARDYVRREPRKAICKALVAGFVVGLMLRR